MKYILENPVTGCVGRQKNKPISCALASLGMYIDKKGLSTGDLSVAANMYLRIEKEQVVTYFERYIFLNQPIPEEVQQRLQQVAEESPVSMILKDSTVVYTNIKNRL